MKHLLLQVGGVLLLQSLAGCCAYAPLQPTMPVLTQAGQAEAQASLQPTLRLEAQGAYSPAPHVVVAGAGTVGLQTTGDGFLRTQQGELSGGGYWNIGRRGLISLLGGGGQGTTRRRYCVWGCDDKRAYITKLFGQAGVAWEIPRGWQGITYRVAQLQYSQVLNDGLPVADFPVFRHELLVFQRRRLGISDAWFVQTTAGVSFSNLRAPSTDDPNVWPPPSHDRWFTAGLPALMLSLGVSWQPPLRRSAPAVPPGR